MAPRHPSITNRASNPAPVCHDAKPSPGLLPHNQASNSPRESTDAGNRGFEIQLDRSTLPRSSHGRGLNDGLTLGDDLVGEVIVTPDIWSAAYREAVDSLGDGMDIEALKGKDIAQLFKELEDTQSEVASKSAFSKGVRYLQTLQVPLERFKQVLDLASPLASLEPTAATVVGVVRCMTTVSPAVITLLDA